MGDAHAAALAHPCRNLLGKIIVFCAALQLGPTQCVTSGLSHNTKKVGFVSRLQLPCGKFFYCLMENNDVSAEFLPCSTEFLSKFCEVRCCRFFHKNLHGLCSTQKSFENHMPFCPIVCLCDKPWMLPAVLKRVKMSSQMEHEQSLDNLLLMCVSAKASVKELFSKRKAV